MKDATSPTTIRADKKINVAAADSCHVPVVVEFDNNLEKVGSGQIAAILSVSPIELFVMAPKRSPL